MQEPLVERLLEGLRSSEPDVRERAADEVTDIHKSLGAGEVDALINGLMTAALQESLPACQEAELNAFVSLELCESETRGG